MSPAAKRKSGAAEPVQAQQHGGGVAATAEPKPVVAGAVPVSAARPARRSPSPADAPAADDLVQAARAAAGPSGEGAAIRCGGTIAAAAGIHLASLHVSPLRAALVTALAGGAATVDAAVVVTAAAAPADSDVTVLRELGGPGLTVQLLRGVANPEAQGLPSR